MPVPLRVTYVRIPNKASRPLTLKVYEGKDATGELLFELARPFRCPMGQCKCCCYQEITAAAADGAALGSVAETMYCCPVPSFMIMDAAGEKKFEISPPVCCGGCCVDVCAEGCCNCKIPFYLYPPGKRQEAGAKVRAGNPKP
jgi:hypothetical protein